MRFLPSLYHHPFFSPISTSISYSSVHPNIITTHLSRFLFFFSSMASSTVPIDAPPQPMNQNNAGDAALAVSHKSRVTVVGSGNWGSVAAKLIASNTLKLGSFHDEVRMWVFEEKLPSGEKLTDVINRTNENVKYLPGIKLGKNVIADPDLENAVKDANMLVFVTPHQFMEGICKGLVGKLHANVEGISLIKGMEVKKEGPQMISALVSKQLGINCCVLMGANIANEIALEKFSEATVGYRENRETADKWVQLFSTPYFMVTAVQDVEGVELCGTLKNVVAIAAGFVDGLDMGNNTKVSVSNKATSVRCMPVFLCLLFYLDCLSYQAAIMRIGLREMRAFSKLLFPSVKDSTFFESCGVADLITTCLGGRNRKVAEAFAKSGGKRSFDELEAEMLQGQKLQGVSTAKEVYEVLTHRGWLELFPLFATVNEICIGSLPPSAIVEYSEHKPKCSEVLDPYN
ncbi:glycerol-3-phosphate dehydrogenase [Tripterygium wilfordii]|uniref:Glycerol-3-phosphate dehydrogenase [NAD(+)] n=1 Tax=Tripterygium wilfordii TaxID=458696 RepID=A0A7J7DKR9_TRIWF|nr:glycerol-3-phosphate dehydrogenase [Tripterygium wilfordii]